MDRQGATIGDKNAAILLLRWIIASFTQNFILSYHCLSTNLYNFLLINLCTYLLWAKRSLREVIYYTDSRSILVFRSMNMSLPRSKLTRNMLTSVHTFQLILKKNKTYISSMCKMMYININYLIGWMPANQQLLEKLDVNFP